jgi:hypothetical protein
MIKKVFVVYGKEVIKISQCFLKDTVLVLLPVCVATTVSCINRAALYLIYTWCLIGLPMQSFFQKTINKDVVVDLMQEVVFSKYWWFSLFEALWRVLNRWLPIFHGVIYSACLSQCLLSLGRLLCLLESVVICKYDFVLIRHVSVLTWLSGPIAG